MRLLVQAPQALATRFYAHTVDLPVERSPQARLQGVQLLYGTQQNGGED